MSKKMLINAIHPEEARIAIVEDGKLVELEIEIAGSEQIKGNVYKGVVVRVEPSLQAAFVDIGLKKLGFLQMGEIHPDYWKWRDDVPEEQRKKRPRIQEVIRRGQELIVQVEKGERDMKGAALTTYLSLPGRYVVLMPGSDSSGISRKIEGEAERKKLREMIASLEMPEGVGYIVRTEAMGKTKEELQKDLVYQMRIYDEIREKAREVEAPGLIYQETDLFTRTLRDYFTSDIEEVLVDSPDALKRIKSFFRETMPSFEKIVKLHQEKRPIFSRYQIEEQIDHIYEKKVPLPSGGSIVIEPTEALVSIDVNSGKSTGEKGVEDTAFHTNMEAADEIARQLRLRDLGGLIVIDFIDMRDKKHIREVETRMKAALKRDKARTSVGRISEFGILELSRQRIKQAIEQAVILECPHCSGRGKVKSAESMALSFLRKVHAAAAKGNVSEVHGELPLEVAYYLLNRKKRELSRLEDEYDIVVTIKGKPSFLMNQLELVTVKREKPKEAAGISAEAPDEKEPRQEWGDLPPLPEEGSEEPKKKKRRKGKKRKTADDGVETVTATAPPTEVQPPSEEGSEGGETASGPLPGTDRGAGEGSPLSDEKKKRKRHRHRRKKSDGGEMPELSPEEPVGDTTAEGNEGIEPPPAPAGDVADATREEKTSPPPTPAVRRGRKKKAEPSAEIPRDPLPVESVEPVAAPSPEPSPEPDAAGAEPLPAEETARPRRRSRTRSVKQQAKPAASPDGEIPPPKPEEPADETPPKPRGRRKKNVGQPPGEPA